MNGLNNFLYAAFPYLALAVCVAGCIYRFRTNSFKVSSLSSQFLDSDKLFFGSVLFHWSIIILFFAHLFGFLFPGVLLSIISNPSTLIVLETIGLACGLGALVGLGILFLRRMGNERVRMVTTRMDIAIELLILAQIALGIWIAIGHRWGSAWFASNLAPYLWSLVKLNPQVEAVSSMSTAIVIHVIVAFVILLMIPFTRLVHFLVVPLSYLSRPYQQVIWYWDRRRIRDSNGAWAESRPKNN
jgi:nitrate reductase gamma subunit